ncbi:MAG: hypothetical protein R3248_02440 [Candidatus Promineifilaceae bacterium]|nr:hypothetical protein [Candidatus Promineifilaceae bacterium]
MRTWLKWIAVAGGLVILAVACREMDRMSTGPSGTGYSVLSQFEAFYEEHGQQRIFGEPITGECVADDGDAVQYFQRMRLESDEEGEEVTVYPLGEWAYDGVQRRLPAPVPESDQERFFPTTGFTVQDEFLAFYEANDGETVLGTPISPQLDEGELRVQYFERGRLEWHPSAPRGQRVQVGMLGQAHYDQGGAANLECDAIARFGEDEVPDGTAVRVSASVSAPILYEEDEQVIFVKVATPAGIPFDDIPVEADVSYRGETFTVALGRTNGEGVVSGPLELPEFEPGHEVGVQIRAGNVGETALTFRTWW